MVFKQGTSRETAAAVHERAKGLGGRVGHTYTSALHGFSVRIGPAGLQNLRALPNIAYVEVDQVGDLNTVQPPTPPVAPPAGIDRTSERFLPIDARYTYSETGAGVHVYVIDTGIRATHSEFGGRVSGGTNTMSAAAGTGDCHGHGTHVAGTVGGASFGIAKQVFLHPVRAGDCANTYLAPVIAAVDWVSANRVLPAVANLSSGFFNSPTLNTAVTNSVNTAQVTYAVAAGNANADACTTSPAMAAAAITVGAVDPNNDTRAGFSNFGPCLDLFAPGVSTLSAGITSDTASAVMSGTSMASPHVAGVAARYLQTHPLAAPAAVWAAIHNANNILGTTVGWTGVVSPGVGSPNELLHYGSLNDGMNDGDPHITTVNGIHYDFQPGGEFVALRDANGLEIQTRQTPVPSAPWVSVNTAVAARVGKYRVTWQPDLSGVPDPAGLQLRVDGVLRSLGAGGIALGTGRVARFGTNGIQIDFPDGTTLVVSSAWWAAQRQWYLDVHVFHTAATEGIMGIVAKDSWLTRRFIETWRVTDRTTLFDYAANTSTAIFTYPIYPADKVPPLAPEAVERAKQICLPVIDRILSNDCVFNVATTGDPIFAETAALGQKIQQGATRTGVYAGSNLAYAGDKVEFTAVVAMQAQAQRRRIPSGSVQFVFDGVNAGTPVRLDETGRARWIAIETGTCRHSVAAYFIPDKGSAFLTSRSLDVNYTAVSAQCGKP